MTSTYTDRIAGLFSGAAIKTPCLVATTANITLNGEQTIDGVACVANNRVLVKDQSDTTANGIYLVSTSGWTRDVDFDGNRDIVNGTIVYITSGNTNSGYWRVSATDPIVVGTSAIAFIHALVQDSSSITFTPAGAGSVAEPLSAKISREIVSVFDKMTAAQKADVRARTRTLHVADACNAVLASGAFYVYAPAGDYLLDKKLQVPTGVRFIGESTVAYNPSDSELKTVFVKDNGDTNGDCYIETTGLQTELRGLSCNLYNNVLSTGIADYPAGSGNTSIGFKTTGGAATIVNCAAFGFPQYAFYLGTTTVVDRCYASYSDVGYHCAGTDSRILFSTADKCMTAGAEGNSFCQWIGNRFEWNARIGLHSGGEQTIVGNVFDRNGGPGIYTGTAWGMTITGNYFARNGCGGNGTKGRWDFSVPGHPSYVATALGDSCHIKIDGQRAVVISGNRYRWGGDDGGGGAFAPAYIYSSASAPGANGSIEIGKNAGSYGSPTDGAGYYSAYPGGAGLFGGTDTSLGEGNMPGQYVFPVVPNQSSNQYTLDAYAAEIVWAPTDASGAGLSLTVTKALYMRVGRLMVVQFYVTYPATADGASAVLGGLPVAVLGANAYQTGVVLSNAAIGSMIAMPVAGTTTVQINKPGAVSVVNSELSGKYLIATLIYFL